VKGANTPQSGIPGSGKTADYIKTTCSFARSIPTAHSPLMMRHDF
jgi:hypothetical protein